MNKRKLLSILVSTGVLFVFGYGFTNAYAQERKSNSGQQQSKDASNKTKEIITFKGIPLGKPGTKPEAVEILKKMCLEVKENQNECSFDGDSTVFGFDYGSLPAHGGAVMWAPDGSLMKVILTGSKSNMLVLAETLEAKYGTPLKRKMTVENKRGDQFDNYIFIWEDNLGSRITVESISSDINTGQVAIDSARSVAIHDRSDKEKKSAAQSNL